MPYNTPLGHDFRLYAKTGRTSPDASSAHNRIGAKPVKQDASKLAASTGYGARRILRPAYRAIRLRRTPDRG